LTPLGGGGTPPCHPSSVRRGCAPTGNRFPPHRPHRTLENTATTRNTLPGVHIMRRSEPASRPRPLRGSTYGRAWTPTPSPASVCTEPGTRTHRSQIPGPKGLTGPAPFRDDLGGTHLRLRCGPRLRRPHRQRQRSGYHHHLHPRQPAGGRRRPVRSHRGTTPTCLTQGPPPVQATHDCRESRLRGDVDGLTHRTGLGG